MPRPRRVCVVGLPQHVVQRGVDRQAVFFEDADCVFYLSALAESSAWYGLAVHAYCLMTNHVHLLVTPEEPDALSRTMRRVGSMYVGFVNRRYGRTGALWEGRFRGCLVDSEEYLLACQRYIELNPVRAAMVKQPESYRWSSYRTNGLGEVSPLVTPHEVYRALGTSPVLRCAAYRELFSESLHAEFLDEVRTAVARNHVLGGEKFKVQVETMLGRKLGPGRPGRPATRRVPGGVLNSVCEPIGLLSRRV